jgi:EpsI family protein
MNERRGVVLILILAATVLAARPAQSIGPSAPTIGNLSYVIDEWRGAEDGSLDQDTAAQLGADAYLTRTYSAPAGDDVALYVAYYGSQRPGVSIHSPLHCLPGTGWEPIDDTTVPIATGAVRLVTMQKNLNRVVVIYWYQMHGRAVASEIRSKMYGLFDRVRNGRSTAALVRIAVPITGDADAAAARGLSFVGALLPQLAPVL